KEIEHLYNICWSNDGRWIVSTVHGGMGYSHAILAIEVNGNRVIDLKIPGCRPDLSPDGKRVVWGSDDTTFRIGDIDLDSDTPSIANIITAITDELHIYHSDWSPDGRYISFSRGPGGKTQANGPGTHRGIAELVGVRAQWDICVFPVSGDGGAIQLTSDGMSNKESDWLIQPAKGGTAR
ncbi:MAG: hypothetical protein ABIH23_02415, partial [bacterium]